MAYEKRYDGRADDELREVEAKVGVIARADGSAMFRIGKTVAIAAVYGPKEFFPQFLQNPEKGTLRCSYNMLAFSGAGERVRPGPSRRSKEIGLVMGKALLPVVILDSYGGAVVDVYVELIQTDASTRCAGIVAASMALADAGIPMRDLVSAVSVGVLDGKVVVDVSKEEEDYPGEMTDIPVAMCMRSGKVTLLQADGKFRMEELEKGLEMAKKSCAKIAEIQEKSLRDKYKAENDERAGKAEKGKESKESKGKQGG